MVTDAEMERRISAGESTERIADAARRGGMRSMWDSGAEHVAKGDTDVDELLRVLEIPTETTDQKIASAPRQGTSSSGGGGDVVAQLDQAGFTIDEEGTKPVTLYWLARKQ